MKKRKLNSMPKYLVSATETYTGDCNVYVEADTPEQAYEKACSNDWYDTSAAMGESEVEVLQPYEDTEIEELVEEE